MPVLPQHRTFAARLAAVVLTLAAAQTATAPGAFAAGASAIVCGTVVNPARQCLCTKDFRPVCARLPDGTRRTFPNACVADCAGARVISCGKC